MTRGKRRQRQQQSKGRGRGPPPPSFTCPLSGEIMSEPVMDCCAHTFERKAILAWLDDNNNNNACCPISRKPLTAMDLMPNHTLGERIDCWKFHQSQRQRQQQQQPSAELDGILKDESTCSMTTPEEDDVDDFDVEQALQHPTQKGPRRHSHRKQYQAVVPAEFMLLPQERELLATVRIEREEQEALRRRKQCYYSVLMGMTAAAVIVSLAAIFVVYMQQQEDEEE